SWYGPPDGALIPGATGQTYHPSLLGYYYAIKDTISCRSDTSNVIYVSLLGVDDVSTKAVTVYPNPTSGIINLDWQQPANAKLDVYTFEGRGLIHEDIVNETHHRTNMSYLPDGNYFIVLSGEDGSKRT